MAEAQKKNEIEPKVTKDEFVSSKKSGNESNGLSESVKIAAQCF